MFVTIIFHRASWFRWMWEMFESDYDVECDNDCGPGPPPIFNLPPPPRPDFLQDLDKCSENSLSDYEMCEAIPVSDDSSLLFDNWPGKWETWWLIHCSATVSFSLAQPSDANFHKQTLSKSNVNFLSPNLGCCYLCCRFNCSKSINSKDFSAWHRDRLGEQFFP